jgi:hypothetical protein
VAAQRLHAKLCETLRRRCTTHANPLWRDRCFSASALHSEDCLIDVAKQSSTVFGTRASLKKKDLNSNVS